MNDLNVIVGAQPALFTSRTCGNVAWVSEEVDAIVGKIIDGEIIGVVVTFSQAKVLLQNRQRKIAGSLGKPILLN